MASQLVTPNPGSTKTAINANQSIPKIDSVFIKTGMGPNGTANTMLSDIDKGLLTTSKVHLYQFIVIRQSILDIQICDFAETVKKYNIE